MHTFGGAGLHAGAAAGTLVGIHQCQITVHGNSSGGADLAALGAADTAGLADVHDRLSLFGVGTTVKDLLMLGKHMDHLFGTGF